MTTNNSEKMLSLQKLDIFELKPLITNISCKLSTVTEYDPVKQILCLVSEENEIVLRYIAQGEQEVLKLISWFRRMSRVIHDVCFDPTGTWLLVLCFDNTLHIIPALAVVGGKMAQLNYPTFSTTQVTSYIIPFVGPHECPNSKACPNHDAEHNSSPMASTENGDLIALIDDDMTKSMMQDQSLDSYSYDLPTIAQIPSNVPEDKTGNDQVMCTSFMCSSTCPYPLSVVWWQTVDLGHRAIIGYSDGSICFVGLSPNCPFVASTAIESGSVVKLLICKDNNFESVMLLITSSLKQQYKLLLEQNAIQYVYPGDISPTSTKTKDEWQIVMPVKRNSNSSDPASEQSQAEEDAIGDVKELPPTTCIQQSEQPGIIGPQTSRPGLDPDDPNARNGILPAARARLASLKSLGSKKLNAIKMKLSDHKLKMEGYSSESSIGAFTIMDSPSLTPEAVSMSAGSFYTIQNLRHTYLLSALHEQSNTLSVHSMDISLKPVFLYKIPNNCHEILISSNILYSIQYVDKPASKKIITSPHVDNGNSESQPECDAEPASSSHMINAVGVISSAMASVQNAENDNFNDLALLRLFNFENETVLNLYQMNTYVNNETVSDVGNEEKHDVMDHKSIRSAIEYVHFYQSLDSKENYSLREMEIMKKDFPKICYDPCYVVSNKNVYYIHFKKEPFEIFLDAALAGKWTQCHEFCNTFDLSFEVCIEFAGDYLLRKRKVAQALLTYNAARIKPIRTALKLAMFGQTYALMHLCAMALKSLHILRSHYLCHSIIKDMLDDIELRHSEDVKSILPTRPSTAEIVNEGLPCSDYQYGVDECMNNIQMSPPSQYHLANLLLITLAEKAVKDKNYIPLWNFLVSNSKFHTNMTSIVLCQSGLYSAALVLSKARGACIDTFLALNNVVGQEFGWYSELNVCLYNMSESIFMESITYLSHISMEYFAFLQDKIGNIRDCVLKRLEKQLNPFSAVFRPIVSNTSSTRSMCQQKQEYNDNNSSYIFEFCKSLIETYLAVLIHMESLKPRQDNISNALSTFRLTYEDVQFAIETSKFSPLSAGFAHCACIVDGTAYFWGSNGIPCSFSVTKSTDPPEPPHAVKCLDIISQLNLEVHAVVCGRQHSLILTNNGLYAFGNNNLCQLGIGKHMLMSLQPMLVKALDGKSITSLVAGQYHNAVIADGFLYTWGWGVYGQLGHGSAENVPEPKMVSFFEHKVSHATCMQLDDCLDRLKHCGALFHYYPLQKVLQVSLGHAHSVVLCKTTSGSTEVYVFGSNHFGQLGIGLAAGKGVVEPPEGQVKSLNPMKIEISSANIRLIHTKFFSNLAVDENNRLYTWGLSPQALRLANQIKRRANAKQKIEEFQRKEISKRFEETISSDKDEVNINVDMQEFNGVTGLEQAENKPNTENITKEIEIKIIDTEPEADRGICTKPILEESEIEPKPDPKLLVGEEDTSSDHLQPHFVDTTGVIGDIVQLSSGLFHFGMVTSKGFLYTWGKNLEHQLGTEDKERKAVAKPTLIKSIENATHVECGADFTLVMSRDYIVKAFGGNANGQCARDLGALNDKMKQRVVLLPTTKRLMRYESQCVEIPTEVNLPRPRIRLDFEPVRYLKIIPEYQPHFIQESGICLEPHESAIKSPLTTNPCPESDDMVSSLENLSFADSIILSGQAFPTNSSNDISADEQSYSRLPPSDDLSSESTQSTREFRNYIHYCLYIFHGLYNPDKIAKFSAKRLEYHIRTLMLNFKFVEAFTLCLTDSNNASKSLKIFEYFTKDTSFVPMRRQDLKFFIYRLFQHFIAKKFDIIECEEFFLSDLDYYLLELSYVLYFNNNNTELEQNLNQKFKSLITQDPNHNDEYRLEDTDAIFDMLSVKFKTIVCQSLLKYCEG